MKRYWLASLFSVGIMCGLSSVVYAVDLEAVLKDNTANSGFSVKDASGNTIARFRGDGNVGIGTAGPTTLLDLKTTTVGEGLALKEIDSSTNAALLSAWSTGSLWNQYTNGVATIHFDSTTGGVNWFNNGNVGIGTTTPEAKLSIQAVENMTNLLVHNRASNIPNASVWFRDTEGTPHNIFRATGDYDADAGGPYEFVINQSGNVGIGTTTPGYNKLYIETDTGGANKGNPGLYIKTISAGPNTNPWAIRLENDLATNGGALPWGLEAHYSGQFRITTHSADYFTIRQNGNVGIGASDPSYKLYVAGAAYSTGGWSGSDVRWKKDITPLENSLNNVLKLQGVHYYWKTDEYPDKGFTKEKQIGLIAQDVEKVIPELVNTSEDGYKSVSYEKLTAVLVEAVKELKAVNNKLKAEKDAEICSLKSEISELRMLINKVIEPPAMPASHKQSCAGVYDNDGI